MNCLRDATRIICTVGSNNNEPGMTIFQRTALTITSALSDLRAEAGSNWKPLHITILTSASTYSQFTSQRPWSVKLAVENAYTYIYNDLVVGENILTSFPSLMTTTFIHAPLIVDGERTG